MSVYSGDNLGRIYQPVRHSIRCSQSSTPQKFTKNVVLTLEMSLSCFTPISQYLHQNVSQKFLSYFCTIGVYQENYNNVKIHLSPVPYFKIIDNRRPSAVSHRGYKNLGQSFGTLSRRQTRQSATKIFQETHSVINEIHSRMEIYSKDKPAEQLKLPKFTRKFERPIIYEELLITMHIMTL